MLLCGGGAAGWLWWKSASAPTALHMDSSSQGQAQVQVTIPQGTSAEQVGQILQEAGLIRSLLAWKVWTRWSTLSGAEGGFQAGTYALSPTAPLPEIAQRIWTGQVLQASFTIPEGWSLTHMAAYFEAEGWFSAADFLAAAHQIPRDRYPWLPADLPFLEGFLAPETYQLPLEQRTPETVIGIMLDRFETVALPLYRARTAKSDLSLLDWVTLASIVEQEAAVATERTLIAGVFWNRLRQGIALGADPTVEYGLGITQSPDRPLTLAQVNTPSPYNTYLNPGLPPTPIASPSLASLKAVLNPDSTPYLYFVARYDGTHVFSRTLAEHERAQIAIRNQQDAQRPSRNL